MTEPDVEAALRHIELWAGAGLDQIRADLVTIRRALDASPAVEECVECIAKQYHIAALQESNAKCALRVAELWLRLSPAPAMPPSWRADGSHIITGGSSQPPSPPAPPADVEAAIDRWHSGAYSIEMEARDRNSLLATVTALVAAERERCAQLGRALERRGR